jgi:hypothetical protein
MRWPDFAVTDLSQLAERDLKFILENFPRPVANYEEVGRLIHHLPNTLESLLNSEYLFDRIIDQGRLVLDISPFLLFSVLLRRSLRGQRTSGDRKIINYIANLLSVFVRADRVHHIEPYDEEVYEYLFELVQEGQEVDSRRQFLTYSHIGNYALFITGLFPEWIGHRFHYQRRPVDVQYYIDFGSTYYHLASNHPLAREFGLDQVFLHLSLMFDSYRKTLNYLARQYLSGLSQKPKGKDHE